MSPPRTTIRVGPAGAAGNDTSKPSDCHTPRATAVKHKLAHIAASYPSGVRTVSHARLDVFAWTAMSGR